MEIVYTELGESKIECRKGAAKGLTVQVYVFGNTSLDIELGLSEAKRKIGDGYTSGFDRNETGSYSFKVYGEEVESIHEKA